MLKYRIYSFLIIFNLALTSHVYANTVDSGKAVTFGVFPYVSPGQLVKFHTDLKNVLQETLGRKVVLVTAPSYKEFVKRTKQSNYDYIMTAPHLGRLAEVRDGYTPLVHTMHTVQGVYLAKKSSDINTLKDLEGKVLTTVGRTAIITQMAEQQLNGLGLYDRKNITFRITKTHNNAMYAPLRSESDASITGILLWRKIGQDDRDKVKVIGKTPVAIGFQFMAAKQVNKAESLKLQQALEGLHNTAVGKSYMEKTGFVRFDPVDDKEKKALDPFIQVFLKKKK